MVDSKATAKIEDDQLQQQQRQQQRQQQGDGGDPAGTLLLPPPHESSGDLWDTAGVRMSALCLNVLQDISDAVSQYSSEDRTLVRRKESMRRKGFADFFRIKRKSKLKKSTESTGDDSSDAKKLQNAQNAAIPPPTDNGSSAKESGRKKSGHGKEMSKEFSFGAIDASGRSATLPSNGKDNGNISKDQRGKSLSAEEAKSKKPAKAKSSAVGQKREKGRRLIRPLKILETSIQKIVSNVNNKFPATEDAGYEGSKKENGLNTLTAKPTEETDEKRLFNRNDNEELRDKTEETTGDQRPVDEGQRQVATDTKNAPDAIAVSRESPGTIGRGRARDRGAQLRRGRSEEALPSKGHVKRVRRRALSREWIVVKTTTTECTTTFSATSRNDELRQSTSNELAMTSQQGSNDDVIFQANGRRHKGLLGSERNRENESIARPHRYSNDRPINDFNNNGVLEFPADDVSEILPPVMSKEQLELSQNNSPTDTLTAHPGAEAPEKTSADLNSSQISHNDPLQENSDTRQPMKSVDASPVVNRLLTQSHLFSLDDDESAKDFSAPNLSDALNASGANQFTKALEVSSDAGCTLPLTECHFHSTLDDGTTEAGKTHESHLRTETQQLPSPQSTEIDQIEAFDDQTEKPRKEEGVDIKLSGNSKTVTSGSTKSRWTKRKSAARSRAVEKSPTEDDENSSEGQTIPDLLGLMQSIEARDWQENSIQALTAKTATLSPKLSKPRWTKRKSTARVNRQPDSALLPANSYSNAVQPSNGVYGYAGDGQLCSAGSQNEATESNSVACKPRWTKRQLTVRGMTRALVGVNFAPSYETTAGASPSNATTNRTPKQSPRLRGRRRQNEDDSSSSSSCLYPSVERSLHRNLSTFSTYDNYLSKTGKRRPLITDAAPASHDIDDVITFSTDAPSFLESTPESSTIRNRRWEDVGLDCQMESIRPTDAAESSDRRQRPSATEGSDGAHPTAEDEEEEKEESACKMPIDVERSADSEMEFELCDDGLDEEDLDITPTNDRRLFYSNDDDDYEGSSDCETISDRNESRSHDDLQGDDVETSSWFDASQDGVDSAYFADIDANEGSPMTACGLTGLSSDTDPEATDHGAASDDRRWTTSSSENGSPFVENTSPSEATSVSESSILLLGNYERRRDDAMNDEQMSANEMPGCGSDHKENGDAATRSAIRRQRSSSSSSASEDSVRRPSTAAAAAEAQPKTGEQGEETMSSTESANAEHLKSCRKEELDSESSWVLSCVQTAMEIDSPNAKHLNKDGEQLEDMEERQLSSGGTSANMQHSESTAANSVDCSAEGTSDAKEFSEDERSPTAATDAISARPMSDSVQRTTERDMTTTNHHQPKTDTEEDTGRDNKEAEKETEGEDKETGRKRDRDNRETDGKRDEERRPKFISVDQQRRPQQKQQPPPPPPPPPPRSGDPRPPGPPSIGPTTTAHRMTTVNSRRRMQSEEDGSSHLPLLSLQQQQQQRLLLLHVDVPYSDSGYSETEADTLSPCSFRSSLSRADTVTEAGAAALDDTLTDDDEGGGGGGGGGRFPFFSVSGGDGASSATLDDNKSVFTMRPLGGSASLEGGAIDSAADEVFFSPLNTKTEGVFSAAAAAVSSVRSEWEEWDERRRRREEEEEEENDEWPSLLSFASCDSGIGSSTVNKNAFEFPETNLNDDNGDKGLVSTCAENKQDRGHGETAKATSPDSSERQLTAALAISKDTIRYMESNDSALSQSPDRHEEALRKDIIGLSTGSQQMDRDSLCRPLQHNIPIKLIGIYSSEIEMPVADEKEREIITRFCDSDFMRHQRQTVNSAADDVGGRAKGDAFCAVTENGFNGEDDRCKQINRSQTPLQNVDSEMNRRSQALANGISVDSKHSSTKDEFCLKNRDDQSFDEREKAVVAVDRSESDIARPVDGESAAAAAAAGQNRESQVYGGVFGQLQEPFQHVSCAVNDDQMAAVDATEVPLKSQEVKTKNESEIYNRIHQHEASSFRNVDSLENHEETKISSCLDESEEENQWNNNHEERPLHSEDASEIFTRPTVRDVSLDSPKNEERPESSKEVEQEESASKRNERSTSVVCERSTNPAPAPASVAPVAPAPVAEGEAAATEYNNLLRRSVAGDNALTEESDKGRQVLTWHENAEMFSVYGDVDEGADWPPRPSAWIWNRSRYTNVHRLSVNGDGFFRHPGDPLPCRILSCPLPFAKFSLVTGGRRQKASSADEHRVKETVNHPSLQCAENEKRSSAAEEQQKQKRHNSPFASIGKTLERSEEEKEKEKDEEEEEEKEDEKEEKEDEKEEKEEKEEEEMTSGSDNNRSSGPSARGEPEGKALKPKDKWRPETTTTPVSDATNDSRCYAQNRLQPTSVSTTTANTFKENAAIEGSILRQNKKSETETETLDLLCSANDSSTEFDEDEAVEAATIVDCIQSTEASSFDGNQSVGEVEGSGGAPLEEEEEEEEDRPLLERDVSSSFGPDADGPSRQHDEKRQTTEKKSRQTPPRTVVESVGATAGSEDSVNGQTQRLRATNEDDENKVRVTSSSVSSTADDSNKSTRHHTNTGSNNTLTYFLASTAGLLSIILLILISVRQTGNTEVTSSKSHP